MEKKCTKCSETKMLSEFVKHKSYKDGHYSRCKLCTRESEKQWRTANQDKKRVIRTRYREKNREAIRKMDRQYYRDNQEKRLDEARIAQMKYYRTQKGKDKYRVQDKLVSERFPEKLTARQLLRNAVRNGEIIKPTVCSVCACDNKKIEGHHEDYSKPLDVKWVCQSCHGKLHRSIKPHRERLSEWNPKGYATVCSSEETARGESEEFPPLSAKIVSRDDHPKVTESYQGQCITQDLWMQNLRSSGV